MCSTRFKVDHSYKRFQKEKICQERERKQQLPGVHHAFVFNAMHTIIIDLCGQLSGHGVYLEQNHNPGFAGDTR